MNNDIRWKQRFKNFENSLNFIEQAQDIENPSIIEKAGLIQFFEISFELSWNLLKDYLEEKGYIDIKFPRDTIKKAFETELIHDGALWLEALKNRNLTSHTYDEELANAMVAVISQKYYPMLKQLYLKLKPEI